MARLLSLLIDFVDVLLGGREAFAEGLFERRVIDDLDLRRGAAKETFSAARIPWRLDASKSTQNA
jgi:hypothetical protein